MKYSVSVCGILLLAVASAGAQVASHAPTTLTQPGAQSPATLPMTATGKPVARVNGKVLTDSDLVRE